MQEDPGLRDKTIVDRWNPSAVAWPRMFISSGLAMIHISVQIPFQYISMATWWLQLMGFHHRYLISFDIIILAIHQEN